MATTAGTYTKLLTLPAGDADLSAIRESSTLLRFTAGGGKSKGKRC